LETILAAWNQRVYQAGIVVVLLSIFSLGILLAYQSRRTKTQNQVKAVEEALRVNQEELENFFNLSLDLLCITDQDGRFLKVNRAWESILGYGWQTLSSTRYLDFVHPDDLPETLAELEKLGQGEAVLKFINRYRTQAGDHRYIEWFLVPGGAGRVYAAARDITQARLNEDLLREKEARLRHILDKIRVGCLIVDQGGKEHYRNHQFDELFGATDDDFTRREGISGWWRQTALPSWPTQQDIPTAELVLPTKDGMARSLETGGIFLGDKLLLTFFDQTDRRAYEQKLEHAKLAAEEASQAKSNFLANMSHEIRTPMNAILGFTRLALEKNLPEEASGHIRKAYHSAKTLLGILNDVLDFSKIEAGKLDLEIEPVILQDFLRQTAELFEAELRQTGNSLEIKVAADIPPAILTDTLRLGQILRNLISNAVKFTSAGRITLQVQRPSMDGDIAGLEFTVEDTGLGMSPEQVERLFLPFVQGDSSITRRFGGTGLGLAICQKLVGLLGGRIEVSSTLGQGSRFCFLIRVQTIEAPQVRLIRDNAKAEKGDLKGMRILLAEDNALNQQVAQELLHSMGAEVHLAGDGTQAVKMAGQMVFDAILMDLHMPIMDGYEASRLILSQKLCGDAPIFALTAAVLPEDRSRCLAIGMRGFLAKPIEPEELIRALKGVRTNGSDQASRAAPPEKPSLPGPPLFNPESALARLGGNRELLLELLEAFRPQMEADLEKLQPLRDSGRTKNASDIIHGIKGYAGNLGCEGLHAASVELESRLKSGAADPPWEAFMRTADLTLTHIQEWKSGEEI
jgi:PAS domain S-box-containing protein